MQQNMPFPGKKLRNFLAPCTPFCIPHLKIKLDYECENPGFAYDRKFVKYRKRCSSADEVNISITAYHPKQDNTHT